MKKFLLNLSVFTLLLALVNALLLFWANKIYYSVYNSVDLSYRSYLLADSHGEKLGTLTEAYGVHNFSFASDSYLDMERKIEYLVSMQRVDTIYLSVDNHMLSQYRDTKNNLDRSVAFSSPKQKMHLYEYVKQIKLPRYIVFFQPKLSVVLKLFVVKELSGKTNGEAEWAVLSQEKRSRDAQQRNKTQFSNTSSSALQANALKRIVKLAKDHDVTLIGVKFPLTKEYVEVTGLVSFGADSILLDSGCSILDFTMWQSGNPDFFQNQDHLNDLGASQFVPVLLIDRRQ